MTPHAKDWRFVTRPMSAVLRHGWRFGQRCLISPHGTVFETRRTSRGLIARRRREFQLVET